MKNSLNTQKHYKIVGFGVCGANEKYLENTLKEFKRLCDEVVIVGNKIDDKSAKMILDYGFYLDIDDREWGKYQNKIKEDAIKRLESFEADWVISLDMDEVFEPRFTKEEAQKLADKGGLGYFFYIANLYEHGYSEEWSFWNNRMFKYQEPLKFTDKPLHCGLAPELHWRYSNYAPFIVRHYGLKEKADRERKAQRYAKYDPKANFVGKAYYDFLISRSPISEYDEEKLHELLVKETINYHFKDKISPQNMENKKYYYVKNPAGVILDIPDYQLEETLKRDGFTLVSDQPIEVSKGSVESTSVEVKAPEAIKNELECEICGFIAKTKAGLKAHMKKHQ